MKQRGMWASAQRVLAMVQPMCKVAVAERDAVPRARELVAAAVEMIQLLAFALSASARWAGGVQWLADMAGALQLFPRGLHPETLSVFFLLAVILVCTLGIALALAVGQHTELVHPRWHKRFAKTYWSRLSGVGFLFLGRVLLSGVECIADVDDRVPVCVGADGTFDDTVRAAVGVPTFVILLAVTTVFNMWCYDVRYVSTAAAAQGPWAFPLVMQALKMALLFVAAFAPSAPEVRFGMTVAFLAAATAFAAVVQPFYWHAMNTLHAVGLGALTGTAAAAMLAEASGDEGSATTAGVVWALLLVGALLGYGALWLRRWLVIRAAAVATSNEDEVAPFTLDLMLRFYMEGAVPADADREASDGSRGAWATRMHNISRVRHLFDNVVEPDVTVHLLELNFLLSWTRSENTNILVAYRRLKSSGTPPVWLRAAVASLEQERRAALIEAVGETSSEFQRDLRACYKAHQVARDEILAFWKVMLRDDADTAVRLNKAAMRVENATSKANKRYQRLLMDYPSLSSAQSAYGYFAEEILCNPDLAIAHYRRAEGHGDTTSDASGDFSDDHYSHRSGASSRLGGGAGGGAVSLQGIARRRVATSVKSVELALHTGHSDSSADSSDDESHAPTHKSRQTIATAMSGTTNSSGRFATTQSRVTNRRFRERLDNISANEALYMTAKTAFAVVSVIVLACVILGLSLRILHLADKEMDHLSVLGRLEGSSDMLLMSLRDMENHAERGDHEAFEAAHAQASRTLADFKIRLNDLLFEYSHSDETTELLFETLHPVYDCNSDGACTGEIARNSSFATVVREMTRHVDEMMTWSVDEWAAMDVNQNKHVRYFRDQFFNVWLDALQAILVAFEHQLDDSVDDAVVVQYALVCTALGTLLLLGIFVFRPAIARFNRDRLTVTNMFMSIPMSRVRDIIDALHFSGSTAAAASGGGGGAGGSKRDRARRALRRIDETSLRSEARHTRRYVIALLVMALIFGASFLFRITLLRERKDRGVEIVFASERIDFGARMWVVTHEFLNDIDVSIWPGGQPMLVGLAIQQAEMFLSVHEALLYGDAERDLSGAATRTDARHHLLFERELVIKTPHAGDLVFVGADSLFHFMSDRLHEFITRPEQWSYEAPVLQDNDALFVGMFDSLSELVEMYQDEDRDNTRTLRAVEGALFASLLASLLLAIFVSFRPLLSQVKREGSRMRALLLLIPANIVTRIDVIREFLEAEGSLVMGKSTREGAMQTANLMEASNDAYIMATEEGVITFFNDAASRMFGFERDEAIGQNVDMLMPTAMGVRHHKYMDKAVKRRLKGDKSTSRDMGVQKGQHKDGHTFPVTISIIHITQNGVPYLVAVMRDATVVAQDMDAQRKRFLCNAAADVLIGLSEDGVVETANRAAAEQFRYALDELEGMAIEKLVRHERQGTHGEDDGELMHTSIASLIRDNSTALLGVRSDGSTFPLEISSAEAQCENGKTMVASILRDCSERKAAAEDLMKANQLRAASDAKSAFLANMSHEIRTPLNGIIGMNQMILEEELPDQAREYAQVLGNSADSLLVIVNDILDLSKLDAGKVKIEETDMEVTRLVEEVVMSNMGKVGEHVTLSCTCMPSLVSECKVIGDPTRVTQIINNMVSNAIKFTQAGFVHVSVRKVRETPSVLTVVVDVEDTGIGMTEPQQKKLFSRFAQADESTTRKFGGTGLGLSISKQLVDMMGGTISVMSKIGEGSTFSIEFPFKKSDKTELVRSLAPSHAFSQTSLRVLIVCGNAATTKVLSAYMRLYMPRSHAFAVSSALEANEMMRHHPVDVVFLLEEDVSYAARHKWSPHTASVVLRSFTAKGTPAGKPDGLAGAFLHLSLPVRKRNFEQTLHEIVRVHNASARAQAVPSPSATRLRSRRASAATFADSSSDDEFNLPESLDAVGPLRAVASGVLRRATSALSNVSILSDDSALSGGSSSPALENAPRVLIAEDQKINQKVLTSILRKAKYMYDLCSNGQEALHRYKSAPVGHYVCVLMDCQMPVMDGYTSSRNIRELESNEPHRGHITIIAVTAHAMEGEKKKCLDAGMDMFQTKPYRKEQLLNLLKKVVEKQRSAGDAPPSPDAPAEPDGAATRQSVLIVVPEHLRTEVSEVLPHDIPNATVSALYSVKGAQEWLDRAAPDLLVVETNMARQLIPDADWPTKSSCVVVGLQLDDPEPRKTGKACGMEVVCKWPRSDRAWRRMLTDMVYRED